MKKGFSNVKLSTAKCNKGFDNLFDLALFTINEKWNTFIEKEKFIFSFESTGKREAKITVKSSDESNIKETSTGNYVINLDTYEREKEEIISTFIHEVTHISQKFNGFSHYDVGRDIKKYMELRKRNKKLKFDWYYGEVSHSQRGTEKEAKLVQVMKFMEDKQVNSTIELLLGEAEYFTFDFKTFVKKLALFGVNDKDIIDTLRYEVAYKMEEIFDQYKTLFKTNIEALGDFYSYLNNRMPALQMLNIDLTEYILWCRNNLSGNIEKFDAEYHLYNWKFIYSECNRLVA